MLIQNKRAKFDYFLSDEHTAGMILTGLQVKAIRAGKVSLNESYCSFGIGNELVVKMMIGAETFHIKLLLNKKELIKLREKAQQKSFTIVPVNIHLSRGMFKMKIALGKGKKLYDKRQTIKERDLKRDM